MIGTTVMKELIKKQSTNYYRGAVRVISNNYEGA